MNIVSYDLAKTTLLFALEEVAPLGGINTANVITGIVTRYNFAKYPDTNTSREELGKIGLKFEDGSFMGGTINIAEFSIFRDGIVAGAKTTDEAESFIGDMLQWMRNTYKFREFINVPVRRFISQIVVEFDGKLVKLINQHASIINII
jgi:hypothetical protein